MGRLGALLVRTHHDFDPQRFIAAGERTAEGYGSYLGRQLRESDVIVLVAEEKGQVLGYTYAGIEGIDYMALRGLVACRRRQDDARGALFCEGSERRVQ